MKILLTRLTTITLVFISSFSLAQTPLYFNIISHSEVTDPNNYEGSTIEYNQVVTIVKELCDSINAKQAKYNMQVDANFIFGCLKHENANINPNDLLEWANNSAYIDVDPHNHFSPFSNPYNYSDLAYLLDSCGVTLARKILGGVTYADTVVGGTVLEETWTQFATPKAGFTFTNFLWQAEIVWGTATPGHVADYTRFGVWKPKGGSSPTEFGTHDPNGSITHIGGGCKEDVGFILEQNGKLTHSTNEVINNILAVADYIQSHPSSSNDFYTMNMLINFRDMPNVPNFVDSISAIIDGVKPYVDQGKIIWSTLAEKYNLWYASHSDPADHFNFDCSDAILDIPTIIGQKEELCAYPNPFVDNIIVKIENPKNATIKIVDAFGRTLYFFNNINSSPFEFGVKVPAGMYILELTNNEKRVHSIFIKH